MFEQVVGVLDDHAVFNHLWNGALGVVVNFLALLIRLLHCVYLLAEELVIM